MTVPRWLHRARGSVRLRVTVLAAGAFAVSLLVASFVLLRALERVLVDDLHRADEATLAMEATNVFTRGVPADANVIQTVAGGTAAVRLGTPGQQPVVVFAANPDVLENLPAVRADALESRRVVAGSVPMANAALLGIDGRVDSFTVSSLSVGGVTLATASPLDAVRDTIATTRALLWLIGPALVALVAGLAWFLAGRALRPVHAVTSRVADIGSHSLHERVPVPSSADEIAELARTMNGMLGRIESATTASRRLVSDASHELRTPVTVMRTELEVARRATEPDWDATSDVLLDELDRLQGLVDDLLLLARGDERAAAREDVSMVDLVHDVASRPRRVPVEVAAELAGGAAMASISGDEVALRRATDHLVANAARHADGHVRVSVAATATDVTVHVDDDGPGIPVDRRDDVVRRFVRLDEGRSRDAGGAGLGLAVSADVASAHGGRLVIADSPMGGARLSLTVPRS